LGYEGCFLAGLNSCPSKENRSAVQDLYSTAYANIRPTFVVDITKQYEQRKRAILAYGSQFSPAQRPKKGAVHLGLDELENE